MGLEQDHAEVMVQTIVTEALDSGFLMDELLALSAAHRSTLDARQEAFYCGEATRLQTRGLTQYNTAKTDISEKNCMAVFLFSVLLGQHVLFDTFSLRGDLPALLDKLTQCLSLHRGIAAIAGRSWPAIQTKLHHQFGSYTAVDHLGKPELSSTGNECTGLTEMLAGGDLNPKSSAACLSAVETLQHVFDIQQGGRSPWNSRISAIQEWPVRVSSDYIQLLTQRRPEALVILAYYSVLLHHAKEYWIVRDVGSFLIKSISVHLGPYWADWLEWPNKVLESQATGGPSREV
jgi:hypothetical protein